MVASSSLSSFSKRRPPNRCAKCIRRGSGRLAAMYVINAASGQKVPDKNLEFFLCGRGTGVGEKDVDDRFAIIYIIVSRNHCCPTVRKINRNSTPVVPGADPEGGV